MARSPKAMVPEKVIRYKRPLNALNAKIKFGFTNSKQYEYDPGC